MERCDKCNHDPDWKSPASRIAADHPINMNYLSICQSCGYWAVHVLADDRSSLVLADQGRNPDYIGSPLYGPV